MRIKINDKIYRLKEVESGIDSLMELVEETKYKDGDFLHSDWGNKNITIIYKKRNGKHIYYHASKSSIIGLGFEEGCYWPDDVGFRLATESEKKELIDALAEVGKRWNAEKLCIEDIPQRKFKAGDKVRIKDGISSKTHMGVGPVFACSMDKFIGKELTVKEYSIMGEVVFYGDIYEYEFSEDWLEPYEELKKGDLAIFWDNGVQHGASVRMYDGRNMCSYCDTNGFRWDNAIKFESKEQYEKLLKGEI